MKEFLQGRWLNHPLHPALVHVPTSVWPIAFLIDLLTYLGLGGGNEFRNALVQASFYAILFGLAAALLAIPTGLADWIDIKRGRPAWKLGLVHMDLNLLITTAWAVNLALRFPIFQQVSRVPAGLVWLSAVASLLLAISGYLGGRMVYGYGISVARLSKDRWRRIAEAGGANLPSQDGER